MAHSGQPMAKGRPAPLQDLQEGKRGAGGARPTPSPSRRESMNVPCQNKRGIVQVALFLPFFSLFPLPLLLLCQNCLNPCYW